jgi:ABC-type branched-subunit amino acid transport system substrate-binding protein
MMLPPAAYIVMNQLHEQGVAPTAKTWLYDGAGIADYPDFWQNVQEAGQYMLEFGLYHPKMGVPELGNDVAEAYRKRTKNEPNRLIFQAADSLFLLVEGIRQAKTTEPAALIKTLETMKFSGARGAFQFSTEPGYKFHQWVEIPYVNYQLTEVNQPVSKSLLVEAPGHPLSTAALLKPAK